MALLAALLLPGSQVLLVASQSVVPGGLKGGPYVDKLVFRVVNTPDQQILALLNNEIDLICDPIDPAYSAQLLAGNDIGLAGVLRNGYGYLTIKTDKYPFDVTNFRRALAFALDKEGISSELWQGLSEPLDSVIPKVNPFSIEGQVPYNYYKADVPLGNQLLDTAGFTDIDNDTIREGPHGDKFMVNIESLSSSSISVGVCQKVVQAFEALHVNATYWPSDWYWGEYER